MAAVVPCRNPTAVLTDCLRALSDLRLEEILVVDDASENEFPPEVLRLTRNNTVRLVHFEKRRGAGAARNHGARATKAEILLFCDADVVLTGGFQEALALLRGKPEISGVQGLYEAPLPAGNSATIYKNFSQWENMRRLEDGPIPYMGSSLLLLRRKDFTAAGGFAENRKRASHEDRILGNVLHHLGRPVHVFSGFRARHFHKYTLPTLLKTDLQRAFTEVAALPALKEASGYIPPVRKIIFLIFCAGFSLLMLLSVSLIPAGAGILLMLTAVFCELRMLHRAGMPLRLPHPAVSWLDQTAIMIGASAGVLALPLAFTHRRKS